MASGSSIENKAILENKRLKAKIRELEQELQNFSPPPHHVIPNTTYQPLRGDDKPRGVDKLRESEEKYRTVVENAKEGILVVQDNQRVYYNPRWLEFTGYTADVYGADIPLLSLIHPDDRPHVENMYQLLLKDHNVDDKLEFRLISAEGKIQWLSCTVSKIPWDGKPAAMILAEDITKRREMEMSLRKNSFIIDAATDAIVTTDLEGTVLTCNPAGSKIYGYTPSELIGQNIAILYPKKELIKLEGIIQTLLKGETIPSIDVTVNRKDGTQLAVTCSLSPLKDGQGQIVELMGIARDVTVQKQIEAALRLEKERSQQYLDVASVMLLALDSQQQITLMNPQGNEILGYSDTELIGKNWFDTCIPHEQVVEVKQVFESILAGELDPVEYYENHVVCKDGTYRLIAWHNSILHDDEGHIIGLFCSGEDITERKQQENQVRMLNQAIENSLNAFDIVNHEGKLIYANQAYVDMWGYDAAEEIIGTSPVNHCANPNLPERLINELKKNRSHVFEFKAKRKDGTIFDVLMYARLDYDQNGNELYLGTSLDITQQKQIQQELEESKERFELAMDATSDGLYDWNLESNEIYYSPTWKRMLGYEDHELENNFSVWEKLTNPDDVHRAWIMQKELLDQKRNRFEMEFKMQHKEGHWVDILSRAQAVFDVTSGKPLRIVGTHIDITERKRAEKALLKSKERFRALFEQAGGYCMILNPNTPDGIPVIVDANRAACASHGYKREEFIGRPVADIDDEEGKRLCRERTKEIMTGKPFYVENMHVRKDGTRFPVAVNAKRIDIGDEPPLIYTVEYDITTRKQIEEQVLRYQQQLKSLTSKLTLTEEHLKNSIAMQLHDNICQSLVMLRVSAGMLAKSVSDKEAREDLDKMYAVIGDLIDETKTLTSNLSYPQLHLFGFEEAVHKWSEEELYRKHHIQVYFSDDKQEKPLSEDIKVVLFRGIRELLTNVVKHAQASKVSIKIERQKQKIIVQVKDNGKGFDTEQLASGRGFGVLSVLETLERLGGQLQFECTPNQGCLAIMTAPLALASTKA